MNEVERLGYEALADFLSMTNSYTLCYVGREDVPFLTVSAVRAIVKEYLNVHYAEMSNAEDD